MDIIAKTKHVQVGNSFRVICTKFSVVHVRLQRKRERKKIIQKLNNRYKTYTLQIYFFYIIIYYYGQASKKEKNKVVTCEKCFQGSNQAIGKFRMEG